MDERETVTDAKVVGVDDQAPGPADAELDEPAWRWEPRSWLIPCAVLVAACIGSLAMVWIVQVSGPSPFAPNAAVPWIVAAIVAAAVLLALHVRGTPRVRALTGPVGVVVTAMWAAGYVAAQTVGSPFGFWGVAGDMGRLSALATKFSVTWTSADPFLKDEAAEYPTLFPWIVGRASAAFDAPAWQVLAPISAAWIGLSVVAGWLLWRRLVGDLPGLLVTIAAVSASGADPRKAFEVMALALLLPWLISTFMRLPADKGGLHWLPAGVVGGLMVSLYQAYLLFTALAIVALIVVNLTRAPRWPYVKHLALTAITAFVVSAWYLVPWLLSLATQPNDQVSDEFFGEWMVDRPFLLPWQQSTVVFALIVAGLVVSAVYVRRTSWAPAMLAVILSCYVFRVFAALRFRETGHTLFFHYTVHPILAACAAAVALATIELWRARRREGAARRLIASTVAVAAAIVLLVTTIVTDWKDLGVAHSVAARGAHGELWPDLRPTRYSNEVRPLPGFPSAAARDQIEALYGAGAVPIVLADSERLFAFYPMYAYVSRDRTASSSLQTWDDRHAEIARLSAIQDPATFAREVADSRFGSIDVFILKGRDAPRWLDVSFDAAQFESPQFIRRELPADFVMYLRVDADVDHKNYPR